VVDLISSDVIRGYIDTMILYVLRDKLVRLRNIEGDQSNQ